MLHMARLETSASTLSHCSRAWLGDCFQRALIKAMWTLWPSAKDTLAWVKCSTPTSSYEGATALAARVLSTNHGGEPSGLEKRTVT